MIGEPSHPAPIAARGRGARRHRQPAGASLLINKGNVAHHLGVLVEAGLVRKGPTRTVRGGTEQYYLRVARKIDVEPGEDGAAHLAMMDNLAHEMVRDPDAMLNHRIIRLTARQARALAAHLDAIVNDLEPADEREQRYGVVVACYRHGPSGTRPSS